MTRCKLCRQSFEQRNGSLYGSVEGIKAKTGRREMAQLELKVRVQRHLCLAHLAEDDGEFAFVLCRRGLERLLGQRLKNKTVITVRVDGKLIKDDDG